MGGGDVMVCDRVDVGSSSQPQKRPGVLHSPELCENAELLVEVVVVVGSLQPHQPGVAHSVDVLAVVLTGVEINVVVCVVVSSLQPNQPGVLQVDVVVVVVVLVLVVVPDVVVVSSRHPHHPGVAHVSVRVFVRVDTDVAVVLWLLLPSTSFHDGQS